MSATVDFQAALERHQAGDLDAAEGFYRRALQSNPNDTPALHGLGVIEYQRGRLDAALLYLNRVVELDSRHSEALVALGAVLSALGRPTDAVARYNRAIEVDSEYAEAFSNRGNALRRLGLVKEAAASFRRAIAIRPDLGIARKNLGATLLELGRPAEAFTHLAEATRLLPNSAEAFQLLGKALSLSGQHEEAIRALTEATRLQPGWALAHHDLGTALKRGGRPDEALASFDTAIVLRPDAADSRVNRSTLLLQAGDFDRGWAEYEWRRRHAGLAPRRFPGNDWSGETIVGKTLLLVAEQGLGDTLQFIRYARLVRASGARVVVAAPARLLEILGTCPGIDAVVDMDHSPPPFDVQAPLLSLPYLLKASPAGMPSEVPYLGADPVRAEHWRKRLTTLTKGLRIGVCWRGNPDHPCDDERSFPLDRLEPLAGVADVQLISLQLDAPATRAEVAGASIPVVDLGGDVDRNTGAFVDTAAIMKSLDLVVTADTAHAHLAGALGVPVWIALGRNPDWRWQLGRDDSPWYPSARLFRREWSEGWARVFESMARVLQGWIERRRSLGLIPVMLAPGELLDKITILEIKAERITDPLRLDHVRRELSALRSVRDRFLPDWQRARLLIDALRKRNASLWDVENLIRAAEADGSFGPEFLEHARSVARHNDARFALKRRLNEEFEAAYGEQKDYLGAAVPPVDIGAP